MSRWEKVTAAVCVALHLFILWNVWEVTKMTPRVVQISACDL